MVSVRDHLQSLLPCRDTPSCFTRTERRWPPSEARRHAWPSTVPWNGAGLRGPHTLDAIRRWVAQVVTGRDRTGRIQIDPYLATHQIVHQFAWYMHADRTCLLKNQDRGGYGCRVIQRLIEYCASVQISALLDEVLHCCSLGGAFLFKQICHRSPFGGFCRLKSRRL